MATRDRAIERARRWTRAFDRACAASLCAAGALRLVGCIVPTPGPEPDSGSRPDAAAYDAATADASTGDAGRADATTCDARGDATDADSSDDSPLDASPDRTDATLEVDGTVDADASLDAADSEPQDGPPFDSGTPGDATSDAAPSSSDAEPDGADEGDASVVITVGSDFTIFPQTTCGTAPPPQTFTLTNPGSTPATWTASLLEGVSPLLPSFIPPGGTVPPGGSANTTLVFPVIGEPLDGPAFTVQFSSGATIRTLRYSEVVAGYIASASDVDLGDVTSTFDPIADADFPEIPFLGSVGVSTGTDVTIAGSTATSQCASFNTAQSGSSLFHVTGCLPMEGPGATLLLQFDAPEGTPPGRYQTTFSFVGNPEPPCNAPAPFTVTVTLLAPDASMP